MNKRAATRNALAPLWQIGDRHSIFAGPLQYNAPHSHSVPVLIAGLHGKFAIRFRNSGWHNVEAALVRAGTAYELDVAGYPVCVLYLEPTTSGFDALQPLLTEATEHEGALTGRCRDIARWRTFYEDPESMTWAQAALDDLIAYQSRAIGEQSRDARIAHALQHLQATAEYATTSACAARINLSASRFQHIFTTQVGVPFRRYRSWCRLRIAVRDVVSGASFTGAAHSAGFADQAHFSRMFRQTFGAPPSRTLSDVRR